MSCQASQESKHTGVHLEKRETLGGGEVKDVPSDDECDPAVECFSVVYRGESTARRKPTLHSLLLRPDIFSCGLLGFTFTLLPPPPPPPRVSFAFAPVLVTCGAFAVWFLVQHSYFYSTVSAACHRSVAWRRRPSFDHTKKHNRDCHLYFPTRPLKRQRSEKHVTLIKKTKKTILCALFVCCPSLCFQRPVMNSACRLCVIGKTSREPEFTILNQPAAAQAD